MEIFEVTVIPAMFFLIIENLSPVIKGSKPLKDLTFCIYLVTREILLLSGKSRGILKNDTATMPGEICQISSLSDPALLLAIKNRTSNELASFDKYMTARQILLS